MFVKLQEHPPHLNQPSRPEVSPRPMNKSQSETRFRSGMPPRPKVERRHNTVSHAPKGLVFNGSGSRKKHRKIGDDVFEDKKSARRSKDGEIKESTVIMFSSLLPCSQILEDHISPF